MKRLIGPILTLALLVALPLVARGAAPDSWARWSFLIGEWVDAGGGDPGAGSGGSTFALELDGNILVRHNRADYPATPGRPAVAHRDLLIVYPGACDSLFRASYFDNEGHVIQYRVLVPAAGGRAVFDSDGPEPGPRFRLTYETQADGGVAVVFFTGPPGGELKRYVSGTLRRKGAKPGR
jgi:hypothetical protein